MLVMILRVTRYGESVLTRPTVPVQAFDDDLRRLAADMLETMYTAEGVGLAAPQVASSLRLCVLDVSFLEPQDQHYTHDGKLPPLDLLMPMAMVNPLLERLPGREIEAEEGCLSFPGLRGDVPRAEAISVHYQDLTGAHHVLEAAGWFARVVQHEVDHLDGILFTERMAPRQLRLLEPALRQLKRETLAAQAASDPPASEPIRPC
jgi:peptide deformylase